MPAEQPSARSRLSIAVLGAPRRRGAAAARRGPARRGSAEAGTAAAPSFTRDVAPIVRDKCAGCHRLGGIAPFAFRTAHDVSSKATLIAAAVQERRMPPWPPGPKSARFAGQDRRTLSPAERDTLLRWVRTGARVDGTKVGAATGRDHASARRRDRAPPQAAGAVHAALGERRAPTTTAASCSTRSCPQDAFATSIRIEPDAARLVHHVILFRAAAESVAEANALDRASPGPGWSCFGGTGISAPVERRARLAASATHRGSPPGRRAGVATGSPRASVWRSRRAAGS